MQNNSVNKGIYHLCPCWYTSIKSPLDMTLHVDSADLSRNPLHWEQYLCLHILCLLGNSELFSTSSPFLVFLSYLGILLEVFDNIYSSFLLFYCCSLFYISSIQGVVDLWLIWAHMSFLIKTRVQSNTSQSFRNLFLCTPLPFKWVFWYLLFFTILIHVYIYSVKLIC